MHLHAHRDRLPGDALPLGGRADRPLGPILAEDHGHSEPKPLGVSDAGRGTGARAIGGAATALSIVVPVLIPTFSVHLFDFGPGTGGDDDINIENPMVDLRRDLVRGEDVAAGHGARPTTPTRRTSGSRCSTASPTTSGAPATATSRRARRADGAMPGLVGLSRAEPTRKEYDYQLDVSRDFRLHAGCRPRRWSAGSRHPATGATTPRPWTSSPATTTCDTAG